MRSYRVFCLDGASRIQAVEIIEAVNDAEAITAAKKLDQGVSREIWERDRLISRIPYAEKP